MEYGNPILIKGPFRVVPLLEETENQRRIVVGYAVLNAEGVKL
jgi:hypothetical protein